MRKIIEARRKAAREVIYTTGGGKGCRKGLPEYLGCSFLDYRAGSFPGSEILLVEPTREDWEVRYGVYRDGKLYCTHVWRQTTEGLRWITVRE